jgi:hypothetical protein
MSSHKIEIGVDKQSSAANKNVTKSLEGVRETIKKTNSDLGVLTRSMQTFERVTGGALRGVSRGFADMFKNANAQADALIGKMQRMQSLFSKGAPTLFGPNGQVVSGPGTSAPGSQTPTLLGPNGHPAPPAPPSAPPPGGGGNNPGGGGNSGGTGNVALGRTLAVLNAIVTGGTRAFDAYARYPVMESSNKAKIASLGGELRGRLVGGDVSDMWALSSAENVDFLQKVGGRARTSGYIHGIGTIGSNVLQAGGAIAGAVGLAGTGLGALATPAAGAIVGNSIGNIADAVAELKADGPTAAEVEGIKMALASKKAESPILQQTLSDLAQNGSSRARGYRLFGTGGLSAQEAEREHIKMSRVGAHFGISDQEVWGMQEQLSGTFGATAGNRIARSALASERAWGLDRGAAGNALGALGVATRRDGTQRLDELIAKGFNRGIKDSRFKEDLASVIVDYSTSSVGRGGEGTSGMADLFLRAFKGGNVDSFDMKTARNALDATNNYFSNASGLFASLNFASSGSMVSDANSQAHALWKKRGPLYYDENGKPVMPDRPKSGGYAEQVGMSSLPLAELMKMKRGEESFMAPILQDVYANATDTGINDPENPGNPAKLAQIEARNRVMNLFTTVGQAGEEGKSLVSQYGRDLGKLNKMKLADRRRLALLINQMPQTGITGSLADIEGTVDNMFEVASDVGVTTGLTNKDRAQMAMQASHAVSGGGDTNSGSMGVANAKAYLDVLEKAADSKITVQMKAMADSAEAMAKAFGQMATVGINPSEEIGKVSEELKRLAGSAEEFNRRNPAGGTIYIPMGSPEHADTEY